MQDEQIAAVLEQEGGRLRSFIRRQVPDPSDVDDILQDVFGELVEAYRLMKPIERMGAWLFRVAQNRITDLFRKKKPEPLLFEDLLPSPEGGPDAAYLQTLLVDELDAALGALTVDQRRVFLAHEVDGMSFAELSAETGINVNTLLSRKHAAVKILRERLKGRV